LVTCGNALPEAVRDDGTVRSNREWGMTSPTGIPGLPNARATYWACRKGHPPVQTFESQPYCDVCDAQMYEIDEDTYRGLTSQHG
jgi:hypothetical protein